MGTNHSYSSDFHQKKRVYYTTTPMTTCPTFTSPRPLLPFPSPHFISYPPSAILRCSATPTKPFSRAISWNVASLRMLMRRNPKALQDLVDEYDPDVVCLQGTKLRREHDHLYHDVLPNHRFIFFNSSVSRLRKAGIAMFSKTEFTMIQRYIQGDPGMQEGQYMEARFRSIVIATVQSYSPGINFQRLNKRIAWDSALRQQIRYLRYREGYPVLVIGDLGVARCDDDVYDPAVNRNYPCYSDVERLALEDTIESCRLVDAYRMLYPKEKGRYTHWDRRTNARAENRGIRRDHVLVTDDMVDAVINVHTLDHIQGSDHCPIAIDLMPGLV